LAYIGNKPTAVPLTSSDITNGIITTAKIADDAISAAKLAAGVGGKVLQVISTNKTAVESINSSATAFTNISGLSATITPSSTSSKIFIMASVVISFNNNQYGSLGGIRIQRGTTGLNAGGESYSSTTVVGQNESANNGRATLPIQFLDSPSTTNATTYNIGVKNAIGGTVTCVINGNKSASNTGSSTITIMEIVG
tara:strand:+ start:487 stop:1074 length:588 start_codon:yes stop_codon:yes gene_type:complete